MDPIPDLSRMNTEFRTRSVSPSPSPAANGAHPPYAEMITTAIAALNEKGGSSKQAIARYIEKVYQNLPPTHSALLTHHLKRLKNEGQLLMVKYSYMLPSADTRSEHFQLPASAAYNQDPDYSTTPVESVSTKRKPGRPPKSRPDEQPRMPNAEQIDAYQPQFEHQFGDVHNFQHQNLQPTYGSGPEYQPPSVGSAEPIFASLGLADDGIAPQPENPSLSAKRGRGRPPKLAAFRRPAVGSATGSDVAVVAGSASAGGGVEVEGGRRGRPRKAGRPKWMSLMVANGGVAKRSRNRPKKYGFGPVTVPLTGNVTRPRGRPRKAIGRPSVPNVAVNGGGVGEGGFVPRSRGRPANLFRRLNGQPLAMPSKIGAAGTAVVVTDPHQLVAYQELKYKYEHLQSKAKEVVNVVKPYLSSEYESAAFGALQELDELTDVAAHDEDPNPLSFAQN